MFGAVLLNCPSLTCVLILPFTMEGTPRERKSRDFDPMKEPSATEESRIAAKEELMGGGGANYTLAEEFWGFVPLFGGRVLFEGPVLFIPLLGEVLLEGGP